VGIVTKLSYLLLCILFCVKKLKKYASLSRNMCDKVIFVARRHSVARIIIGRTKKCQRN